MSQLEDVHRRILSCTACPLNRNRTKAVPGEGSSTAQVMLIGEAPGYQEDQQGRPFVGPAGQYLNELLAKVGLRRDDVFITNMVKCRPPDNRDPYPGEVAQCKQYLDVQIEQIRPKIIVPLGRHALARWFPQETISKARARARRVGNVIVFPLYHPAAALHNQSLRRTIEEDFQQLGQLLKEQTAVQEANHGGQQLSMF